MKVLIVEDEIRIREGIRKLLLRTDEHFEEICEACNGAEGLKLCKSMSPDLIITDIQMPEMDGLMMLNMLSKEGKLPKTIVLSAYSEFEYARGAMSLGITEYLLKPINLNDFTSALSNIKRQIAEDRQKKPLEIGTLEQVLREIVGGRLEISDKVNKYLSDTYGIDSSNKVIALVTYLGTSDTEELKKHKKTLDHFLSVYKGISFCSLEEELRQSLITVIYNYPDRHDLERWLQFQLLNHNILNDAVMGITETDNLNDLQKGLLSVFPFMDWNISFEESILISYPKITQVKTSLCVYPKDIEKRLKSAVCSADGKEIEKLLVSFTEYFKDGKVYAPREIKDCYVRFIWAVLEMAKELGNEDAGNIKQQKLLEQIMNAKTNGELKTICELIRDILIKKEPEKASGNLIIKRAKSMIHEYYNTGITLDEIALRLNITPEYLGTMFHKETGSTFSSYIKNYRIAKAKELLVGKNLKLYEIAERVGYSDAKYFSKVFKDVTGQLPADYRKILS